MAVPVLAPVALAVARLGVLAVLVVLAVLAAFAMLAVVLGTPLAVPVAALVAPPVRVVIAAPLDGTTVVTRRTNPVWRRRGVAQPPRHRGIHPRVGADGATLGALALAARLGRCLARSLAPLRLFASLLRGPTGLLLALDVRLGHELHPLQEAAALHGSG